MLEKSQNFETFNVRRMQKIDWVNLHIVFVQSRFRKHQPNKAPEENRFIGGDIFAPPNSKASISSSVRAGLPNIGSIEGASKGIGFCSII